MVFHTVVKRRVTCRGREEDIEKWKGIKNTLWNRCFVSVRSEDVFRVAEMQFRLNWHHVGDNSPREEFQKLCCRSRISLM